MGSVEGSLEVSDYGFRVITICFVVFFSSNCQMLSQIGGLIPGWIRLVTKCKGMKESGISMRMVLK